MRRLVLIGTLASSLWCSPAPSAQTLDPEALSRALDSTVFIKSERVFRGLYYPSFGTGFFVHSEGYVLTNWHVVADQIEVRLYGKLSEIKTRVVSLDIVIASGSPTEKTVPAKIVALDRERDLALLKVPIRPNAWLDISELPKPSLAQSIWLVGYPLGNLLSAQAIDGISAPEDIPNPSVSINRGMVTSMRRDPSGKLLALQIDASVNPGNSGGPLLDEQGRVIGVVNSKIMGAEGLGFAISPDRLQEFATSKSTRVTFEPSWVTQSSTEPIHVTVEPLLATLDGAIGTIRLHGDGVKTIEVGLENSGALWSAEVPIPELVTEGAEPEYYLVDLEFTRLDSSMVLQRKFRLKSSGASLTVASQRDPSAMLNDRKSYSNEIAISDFTRSGSVSGKNARSLSDVARDVKLKRSESGSIVIDDHTLSALTSPLERNFPPERYDQIGSAGERALARDYDQTRWIRSELESRLRAISTYLDSSNYRTRNDAKRADLELRRLQPEVEAEFQNLLRRIRHTDLVFCHDTEKWYYFHSCPCEAPEVP